MKRITLTLDRNGNVIRICADEAVEVLIVAPHVPDDRVYRWGHLVVDKEAVDDEVGGWPIGDQYHLVRRH